MADIKRAVAIGFFDGVHIGHAALLEKTKQRAAEYGVKPSVVSFDVHPDNLVFGGEVKLISSSAGREEMIKRLFGIEDVVFLHFDRRLMHMPWQDFVDALIEELGVSWIVAGHDFRFGNMGEGNAEKLGSYCAQLGIGCDIIPPVTLDGRLVSSTYIRELLENGDIERANRFLGHAHSLCDTVRSGCHLGSRLGAPTINMRFPYGVLVPRHGVYATKVCLENGEEHIAVTNIGLRPTAGGDGTVSVESHLLDYSGNLYGEHVRVDFYSFIRPEMLFDDLEALSLRIREDSAIAKEYFKKTNTDSTSG